jgi:hypothetical protein
MRSQRQTFDISWRTENNVRQRGRPQKSSLKPSDLTMRNDLRTVGSVNGIAQCLA